MPLSAVDWNVIVVGRWNLAILTPAGVAEQLFGLKKGTPVEVLVALDQVQPHRIKYNDIVVIPDDGRLTVVPSSNSFESLGKAIAIAARSLEVLPKTPIEAVGINVRYSADSSIGCLDQIISSSQDDKLSDEEFEIVGRLNHRSVVWKNGRINISVKLDDSDNYNVLFNLERISAVGEEISEWLETPISDIEAVVRQLISKYLCITNEEFEDDAEPE